MQRKGDVALLGSLDIVAVRALPGEVLIGQLWLHLLSLNQSLATLQILDHAKLHNMSAVSNLSWPKGRESPDCIR